MAELKPCPFCGGKASVQFGACGYNVYQVVCESDNCNAMIGWGDIEEEAINAWNTRAKPEARVLTIEQLKQMHGLPVWVADLSRPICSKWHLVREENVRRPLVILIDARGSYNEDGQYEGCCYDVSTGHNYGKTWLAYDKKPEGE